LFNIHFYERCIGLRGFDIAVFGGQQPVHGCVDREFAVFALVLAIEVRDPTFSFFF
jgi:hypothetical protein